MFAVDIHASEYINKLIQKHNITEYEECGKYPLSSLFLYSLISTIARDLRIYVPVPCTGRSFNGSHVGTQTQSMGS